MGRCLIMAAPGHGINYNPQDTEGLLKLISVYSWWLQNNTYCKVNFTSCLNCGSQTTERNGIKKKYCSKDCSKTYYQKMRLKKDPDYYKKSAAKQKMAIDADPDRKKRVMEANRKYSEIQARKKGIKKRPSITGVKCVYIVTATLKNKYPSYTATIEKIKYGRRSRATIYYGKDFFEAVCARKSFDAGNKLKERKRVLSKSGVVGVYYYEKKRRWEACIYMNRKYVCLYTGNDFFEAVCRRRSMENKYHANKN